MMLATLSFARALAKRMRCSRFGFANFCLDLGVLMRPTGFGWDATKATRVGGEPSAMSLVWPGPGITWR
jgi:hypothetical protein